MWPISYDLLLPLNEILFGQQVELHMLTKLNSNALNLGNENDKHVNKIVKRKRFSFNQIPILLHIPTNL